MEQIAHLDTGAGSSCSSQCPGLVRHDSNELCVLQFSWSILTSDTIRTMHTTVGISSVQCTRAFQSVLGSGLLPDI